MLKNISGRKHVKLQNVKQVLKERLRMANEYQPPLMDIKQLNDKNQTEI